MGRQEVVIKSKIIALILSCQFLLLACSPASAPTSDLTPTSSPIPSPSATVEAPEASATPSPTLALSPTPNGIISAADSQAAGIGTPLPQSTVPITKDNLGDLQLLAEWGRGLLIQANYSADGENIVISTNKGVFVHDRDKLDAEPQRLSSDGYGVLSQDGMLLATETEIIDLETGAVLYELKPVEGDIKLLPSHFSPSANYFAYSSEIMVKVVDLRNAKEFSFSNAQIVAFSPDERTIAVGKRLKDEPELFDLTSGESLGVIEIAPEIEQPEFEDFKPVTSLAFSRDGSQLAIGYSPGLWSGPDNTTNVLEVYDLASRELSFGLDNFGSLDPRPFNAFRCDEPAFSPEAPTVTPVRKIQYSPNGELIAVLFGGADFQTLARIPNSYLYLFRASDGALLRKYPQTVLDLAFSPESSHMTLLLSTGEVEEWRINDSTISGEIYGYASEIIDAKLSQDERILGVQYSDRVSFVNFENGEFITEYAASDFSFSLDGAHIALAYSAGHIEIRDFENQSLITTIFGHNSEIIDMEFLPSGQLVSSASNCTAYLWSIPNGNRVYQFEDYVGLGSIVDETRFVTDEFFLVEGKNIVYGRFDDGYIEWDLETGKIIEVFEWRTRDDERPSSLMHPFLNLLKKRVVSTINDDLDFYGEAGYFELPATYIKFFDIDTEEEFLKLPAHTRTIKRILITSDGSTLISASSDGTIRIWGIRP